MNTTDRKNKNYEVNLLVLVLAAAVFLWFLAPYLLAAFSRPVLPAPGIWLLRISQWEIGSSCRALSEAYCKHKITQNCKRLEL